jgi:hypothetical protein
VIVCALSLQDARIRLIGEWRHLRERREGGRMNTGCRRQVICGATALFAALVWTGITPTAQQIPTGVAASSDTVIRPAALSPIRGDFDGDGQSDLLWESSDGWVGVWLMDGVVQRQALLLGSQPLAVDGWHVAGTGDFDGNGMSDILWQNDDGWVATLIMNRLTPAEFVLLYPAPAAIGGWRIACTGDMDNDGLCDILWEHQDGWIGVWLMDRLILRAAMPLSPFRAATGGWHIAGAAEMTGDGQTDILWLHENGFLAGWAMEGLEQSWIARVHPSSADTSQGWRLAALADMSGEGYHDIVWQNSNDGAVGAWLMGNFTTFVIRRLTPYRVETTWRIVGPK